MKQKILELLTEKFKGARKDTLARLATAYSIQCTTEEEVQALVDKLTETQVTDFEKEYRSEVDSEISKATKTALEKAGKGKANQDPPEGGKKPEEEGDNPTDIAAIIANEVSKALSPLQEEINNFKAGKTTESRLQQMQTILSEAKDETIKGTILKAFNRMSFDDDNAFNEYLAEIKTDIQTHNQSVVNQRLGSYQPGSGGATGDSKFSEADYDAMFNN